MATKLASTSFQCGWVPEGPVSYELLSVSSAVTFSQTGTPSRTSVSVSPFRLSNTTRTPLAVNNRGLEFMVILRRWWASGNEMEPLMCVTAGCAARLKNAVAARFDLVRSEAVDSSLAYPDDSIVASKEILIARDGTDSEPGAFTSTVFCRCGVYPGRPSGGTYDEPVPTSKVTADGKTRSWSDGIPGGTADEQVWMSAARFLPGETNQQNWSAPTPVSSSAGVDVIWHEGEETPPPPADDHPYIDDYNGWRTSTDGIDPVWMAMALKSDNEWSEWQVTRVKGETGNDGKNSVSFGVSPNPVSLKLGQASLHYVYLDIDDGGTQTRPDSMTSLNATGGGGSGTLAEGLTWQWLANYGGRMALRLMYDGSADINMDKEIEVRYNDREYRRTLQIRTVGDGEDSITLDLSNEMEGIACDADGTPVETPPLASSKATVYRGSAAEDPAGWKFKADCHDCTATIAANGYLSVQSVWADTASVKVTATKDGVTRSATMSLYKVRPGKGEDAVVYSIEVSDSAISKDKDGELTPGSISAYQRKTAGNALPVRTSDMKLMYRRIGQDQGETLLDGEGGVISIGAACRSVKLRLLTSDGSDVLDAETVPVVADGENAVQYSLSASPTSVTWDLNSKTYDTATIRVKVFKSDGRTQTEVGDLSKEGLTLQYELYQQGVLKSTKDCPGLAFDLTVHVYSRIDWVLLKKNTEVARQTVGVNLTGQNGTNGKNGVWVPPPMLFDDYPVGYAFQAGDLSKIPMDVRLDIVVIRTAAGKLIPYRCTSGYTKASQSPSPDKDTAHWEPCDAGVYKFLATELLLASDARIEFLSGQAIRVGVGDRMCGYFGAPLSDNGAILFSGADNVSDATFVVYADGRVVAMKAEIEGSLSASTLDLKVSSSAGTVPDGSLCYDVSAVHLPELPEGYVRTLRILNPVLTRSNPESLSLIPHTSKVGVYSGLRFDQGNSQTLTLSECGRNGGVYIELMGYFDPIAGFTHWGVVRNDSVT